MLRFIPHLLVDSTSPLAMKIICKLVETGGAIAIQNLSENAFILLMVGLYTLPVVKK